MHTYKRFPLLFLFIIIGFESLAQGISMSPTRLFLTGNPGETVTAPIILSNSSDKDYVFDINLKDWERNQEGNKVYYDPGTLKNSNADWISTQETTLSLPAHTDKEIVVRMHIPENLEEGAVTNSMLFFTQIGRQEDRAALQNGIGIIALFEFGLHVYYTPTANTNQSLEIESMALNSQSQDGGREITIGIVNDGNVVNDANVALELTNTVTGEDVKLEPINISMLPAAKQLVSFSVPSSLSGNYLGVAIVKMAGTNDMRVGEKNFGF